MSVKSRRKKRPSPTSGRRLKDLDPTRTVTLRLAAVRAVRTKFARLKGLLVKLVVGEDAFGLRQTTNELVVNPFVSEAQRRACYAKDDPDWDCSEWSEATGDKKLPAKKATENVDRIEMPQIRKEHWQRFLIYARERTTLTEESGVDPKSLRGVQDEFSQERVDAIPVEKLQYPILISQDSYVLDGNHRWIKAYQLGLPVKVLRLGLDVDDSLAMMREFPQAEFVENSYVVSNTFCPTGPGGGVDPSCKPDGSGTIKDKHGQEYQVKFDERTRTYTIGVPGKEELHDRGVTTGGATLKRVGDIVSDVGIHGEFRRKGLASALYKHIEKHIGKPLRPNEYQTPEGEALWKHMTINRFQFHSSPDKVKAFQDWLRQQFKATLLGKSDEELWAEFARQGYLKGQGRAFDDVNKKRRWLPGEGEFYGRSKSDFLKSSFGRPESTDKLRLLAGRSFTDVKNVTEDMAARMSRTLMDGLSRGANPRELVDDLVDDLDVSEARAETIARTEIIRAHAEGQLDAFEKLGVEEVGAAVEWDTAKDGVFPNGRVCKKCDSMQGIVLTVQEAHGLIPLHPQCRCAWIPANVGEDVSGQKRSKAAILEAFEEADIEPPELDDDRPKPLIEPTKNIRVTNELREFSRLYNVFCPTGPGGGIDPTCSPGGAAHSTGAGLGSYLSNHPYVKDKLTKLQIQKIEYLNPTGVGGGVVLIPGAAYKHQVDAMKEVLEKVLPAGTVIKVKTGVSKAAMEAAKQPPTPPQPTGPVSTIPYKAEQDWETGKAEPGVLNGVPFGPVPPKFWEKTKDADIKEPAPIHPIQRATVMIEEPDGRVWIVQPTNGFGGRKYTLPGGTNEPHLSNQQNALKEVWEETGLQVEITRHLGDFEDSNNGRFGRLYLGRRIGGAPWDAKIENSIRDRHGNPAAESEKVTLVTKDIAAQRLHRTDDLAQLATVQPIPVTTRTSSNMMKKLVEGLKPAARTYERARNALNRDPGDRLLHAAQELRGFNAPPTVVPKKDMDALVAQGTHIELLRGVKSVGSHSAKELAEEFKSGNHYPGLGCFGSGTYADSTRGSSNVAPNNYGRGGDVIRMAIPSTARIIKQSELEAKVGSAPSTYDVHGSHSSNDRWLGVHAALAGYDAIQVDGNSGRHGSYGKGFYVIINRSVVTVQRESGKGHVIR